MFTVFVLTMQFRCVCLRVPATRPTRLPLPLNSGYLEAQGRDPGSIVTLYGAKVGPTLTHVLGNLEGTGY